MNAGTPEMIADPRRALRVAAILLAAGSVLVGAVWWTAARDVLQSVDDGFLRLARNLRWEPVVKLAEGLNIVGGSVATWTIRVIVIGVLVVRRHWVHLTAFLLAVVTSEALIGPLKAVFDRPRPLAALVETSGASFPSGHAIAAAVTAVGIVIALLPAGHTRWVWERRAALYASLMALSRTYLGAHWLSDVVAGGLLGSGVAIGWPAVLVLWRARIERGREQSQVPS
jgi:undecaprenyl-diphosphatase